MTHQWSISVCKDNIYVLLHIKADSLKNQSWHVNHRMELWRDGHIGVEGPEDNMVVTDKTLRVTTVLSMKCA